MRFSIVMPFFNAANTVARTMSSVCSQTLTDFELLAIDDGSSDRTAEIVVDCARQHMRDPAELRVLRQENRGVGAARNRGMREARGDLIAFLDADDLWSPEYLATVAAVFQKSPQLGALACNAWDMLPGGNHLHIMAANDEVLIVEDFFRAKRDGTLQVRTSGVAIRRSVTAGVGHMREDLLRGEDTEYWSRLAASRVCWGFLAQPLVFYDQVGAGSLTRGPSWYANLPSPETWSRGIWPLLDPSMYESFRNAYLKRARGYCRASVARGFDKQAKTAAKEAFSRGTNWRDTPFLLAVRFVPGAVLRLVWRAGSRVKRLVRASLVARPESASPDRP